MLTTTLQAVKSIMETDTTLDAGQRLRLLAIMKQGQQVDPAKPKLCLLRRGQVAERLSVSLRSVDNLAAAGLLRRVKFPGRKRGCGFLETEVERLMAG